MTKEQQQQSTVDALLNALGVKQDFNHVEVERHEGVITLPPNMPIEEAIRVLQVKRDAEEKMVNISERIEGFPLDVAHSLFLAIDQRYGYLEAKDQQTFFGPQPPKFVTIPIDAEGHTVEVLVGQFSLPGIEGKFATGPDDSKALMLMGTVKQKYLPEVKELAALTREMLKTNSLYKGKAIKIDSSVEVGGMVMPQFINTDAGHEQLLLNQDVISQVEATIWNPIRYMERAMRYGAPVKRGVQLEGDYGTGKTLCANHTARIAEENGWTFVYCKRPEDLIYAYDTARQWQPAVVFAEDIDRLATQDATVKELSVVLDGVDTKDSQLMLVVTTNHVDQVPPILIRPGRIDATIHFSKPDAATVRELVKFYAIDIRTQRSLLDPALDWEQVSAAVEGNIPAVIREIVERSKLAGIRREPLVLTTEDIVFTARQIQRHAELSAPRKKEPTNAERLEQSLQRLVADAVIAGDDDDAVRIQLAQVGDRTRLIQQKLELVGDSGSAEALERMDHRVQRVQAIVERVEETVEDLNGRV